MKSGIKNIDEYISLQCEVAQDALQKMRQVIKSVAREAEEVISYDMPAFKYHGMLVYFAGFKNHYSLFPANSSLIKKMEAELEKYKTSKGTIQFPFNKPMPVALIKKIVKMRAKENLEKANTKTKKSLLNNQ